MAKRASSGNPLEQPFLRAILANPEEDAPRLVYADWLETNGQPARAELIRVQVRLARMPDNDPDRSALAAREKQILNEHQEEWTAPVRKAGTTVAWFDRGMIERAQLFALKFITNRDRLFQVAPLLRDVYLDNSTPYLDRLVALPQLARLTGLTIHVTSHGAAARQKGGGETATALALASSPHLAKLRHLGLGSCRIGDAGLEALANSSAFAKLESLDLMENEITPAGIAVLGKSPLLDGVSYLRLDHNPLGDRGVSALAASARVSRLQILSLINSGVSDTGVRALARSAHLSALESLHLRGGHSPGYPKTQGNRITAAGLTALADSAHLTRLRQLEIWSNPVGDKGVRTLAESPLLGRLTRLDLLDTQLTDAGVLALTAMNRLNNVEELQLGHNDEVGDEAAIALANCPAAAKLKSLDLSATGVTIRGVQALIHSPHLSGLRELALRAISCIDPDTEEPDPAFEQLLASVAASDAGPRTEVIWDWPERSCYVRIGGENSSA